MLFLGAKVNYKDLDIRLKALNLAKGFEFHVSMSSPDGAFDLGLPRYQEITRRTINIHHWEFCFKKS